MTRKFDAAIVQYMKKVKKEVKRSGDRDLSFFGIFHQEVESYLAEKPGASARDLEIYFGTPAKVAEDFLDTLSDETIRKKLIMRKRVFAFLRVAVLIVTAVLFILVGLHVYDGYNFSHGHYERIVSEGVRSASDYESYMPY